jgi:tRNA nucleotidyltransferase (CCA-adding enzyme)
LATAWTPKQVIEWGAAHHYRVILTGVAYGTVTIMTEAGPVEVTTFRRDGRYADGRRPESVTFSDTLEEDLARRDFTVNAMAFSWDGCLIDPFGGQEDLARGVVRAVGDPGARFREDPLRLWRAARLVGSHMTIEPGTAQAMSREKSRLIYVSPERQRDELLKGLQTADVAAFLHAISQRGILAVRWPEWHAAIGFNQNDPHHANPLADHLIATAALGPTPVLRLAGMLHDIAKPTCYYCDDAGRAHFDRHDVVGAEYARAMLKAMAFDHRTTDRVCHLVRWHRIPWDEVGPAAVRRLLRDHGDDLIRDLLVLRQMDIVGSGRQWESGDAVRARVEAVLSEVSPEQRRLAISGNDIIQTLGIAPGPEVGQWLERLTAWIDEDPRNNQRDRLIEQLRDWRDGDGLP